MVDYNGAVVYNSPQMVKSGEKWREINYILEVT